MRTFRESATLILAAGRAQHSHVKSPTNFQYNYDLLTLKRHRNSKFMPSAYVFPGGQIHPSDVDLKWQSLFSTFNKNGFASLIPHTATRPEIFKQRSNELPREISLRITAIRETFEECGILLCKKIQNGGEHSDWAQHIEMPEHELSKWQEKIHNDATEFYSMCKKFECYPDLWALYEWSNWLTPTTYGASNRRFDTAFYMTCMQSAPQTIYEPTEIEEIKWDTPSNHLAASSVITVPPPQEYEITRIAKFENIDSLLDFAIDRNKRGVQLCFPVGVKLQNGNVYVMPGDSMYPEHANLYEEQMIDKSDITIEEFNKISPRKSRIEYFSNNLKNFIVL